MYFHTIWLILSVLNEEFLRQCDKERNGATCTLPSENWSLLLGKFAMLFVHTVNTIPQVIMHDQKDSMSEKVIQDVKATYSEQQLEGENKRRDTVHRR